MGVGDPLHAVLSYCEKQLEYDIGVLGADHEIGFVDGAETLGEVHEALQKLRNLQVMKMPLCPYCGELTHIGGEFLPCCGESTGPLHLNPKNVEWVECWISPRDDPGG